MHVDRTRMYRVSTLATLMDVSPSTIYRAIESGALDALRIGTSLRVPGGEFLAWQERCKQASCERRVLAGQSAAADAGAV